MPNHYVRSPASSVFAFMGFGTSIVWFYMIAKRAHRFVGGIRFDLSYQTFDLWYNQIGMGKLVLHNGVSGFSSSLVLHHVVP
ncbi:hypothetical protein GQ457_08G003520 [Hibiscus cannabinus]